MRMSSFIALWAMLDEGLVPMVMTSVRTKERSSEMLPASS